MCWHKWGKWERYEVTVRHVDTWTGKVYGDSAELRQKRACEKCGKEQHEKI